MACLRSIIYLIFFAYLNCAVGLTPRYSAIVIEAHSGRVLEQEDADKNCHPASLTKMMTLYMVFEALKMGRIQMSTRIPVSAHASRQIPSKLGLRPGEYVTIETIIKGLVIKSANDASAAIAEYLGGSEANFAAMMTRKAKSLGMRKTIFKNASGVPNPHQITTARDMATLSRALYLHYPKDYRHFRLQAFHHQGRVHRNHNHLLGKVPGLDGIKTGWVAASGFNLAASAERLGPDNKQQRLIVVVLGGPNRHWRDQRVAKLLETNFQRIGLEYAASVKNNDENENENENDNDDDDSEVTEFLKEATVKPSTPRPIPVRWPSPSSKPKHRNTGEKDMWGVQIGTYKSLKEAKLRAKKTLSILKSGEISTPKVTKGNKSSYGARLLGISREEAETICKKHAPKGKECRILASY